MDSGQDMKRPERNSCPGRESCEARQVNKKGQATYIAPLQPSTLASFRTWGSSTGAGRIRLARGTKLVKKSVKSIKSVKSVKSVKSIKSIKSIKSKVRTASEYGLLSF